MKFSFDTIEAPQFKVVGNLPYNITSPILFHLIGEVSEATHPTRQRIQQMTLMVQKEVGERITARPGTKAYNHLSIAVQFWFHTKMNFDVKPTSFHPAPKVTSAVITLTPREKPYTEVADLKLFSKLIRAAFQHRRKTLRNSLIQAKFAPAEVIDRMFETAALKMDTIQPGARPETMSIEALGTLANAYIQCTS